MRRLPVISTIIVALAVATMIALGIWQLQRARWKETLLADYGRAMALPAVDLDPLLASGRPLPELSFRRALVTCDARDVAVEAQAGRNAADVAGQAYYVACRPGAAGVAARLRINAGWSDRPDASRRLTLTGLVAGRLGAVGADGPITLVAATPAPPLATASGRPTSPPSRTITAPTQCNGSRSRSPRRSSTCSPSGPGSGPSCRRSHERLNPLLP